MSAITEEQVDYDDAGAGVGGGRDSDVDGNHNDNERHLENGSQNGDSNDDTDDDDNNNDDENDHDDNSHNRRSRNNHSDENENGGDSGSSRRIYRDRDRNNDDNNNELSTEDISNIRDRRRLGNSQGIVEHVLFISRFAATTTKAEIRDHFSPFGKLGDINIMVNIAFIDFANADDANRAKHALHLQPGLGADSLIVDFKKLPGTSGSARSGGYASSSRSSYQSDYRSGSSYDTHSSGGGYDYAAGRRGGGRDDEYDSRRSAAYSGNDNGYNSRSSASVNDEYYRAGPGGSRDDYRVSGMSQRDGYRDGYAPPQQTQRVPVRREEYHTDPYQRGGGGVRVESSRGYADTRGDYPPTQAPPAAAGYREGGGGGSDVYARGAPVPSRDLRDEVRRMMTTSNANTTTRSRSRSRSRERVFDRGSERRSYPPAVASAIVSGYERDSDPYRSGRGEGGRSVRDRDDVYPSVDTHYSYNSGFDNRRPISRDVPPQQQYSDTTAGYRRDSRDSRDREPRSDTRDYPPVRMSGGGRGPRRTNRPLPVIAVSSSGGEIAAFPNPHYPPKHAHHQINSLKKEEQE